MREGDCGRQWLRSPAGATAATSSDWLPPRLAIGTEEATVSERFDFDELARDLAGGLSRREALRRLGPYRDRTGTGKRHGAYLETETK